MFFVENKNKIAIPIIVHTDNVTDAGHTRSQSTRNSHLLLCT